MGLAGRRRLEERPARGRVGGRPPRPGSHPSGIRRAGAAALDLCHVADGRLDGFWELWLAPWDIAAGVLVAREAGATVTTLDGGPDVRAAGPIIAGNPTIHAALSGLLGPPGGPDPGSGAA
ncbi:MAG: inositol monophosphatase family protein [Gemmatimonadota bacterium]